MNGIVPSSMLDSASKIPGYVGIECAASMMSILSQVNANSSFCTDINICANDVNVVFGDLDKLDLYGELDVLILVKQH